MRRPGRGRSILSEQGPFFEKLRFELPSLRVWRLVLFRRSWRRVLLVGLIWFCSKRSLPVFLSNIVLVSYGAPHGCRFSDRAHLSRGNCRTRVQCRSRRGVGRQRVLARATRRRLLTYSCRVVRIRFRRRAIREKPCRATLPVPT